MLNRADLWSKCLTISICKSHSSITFITSKRIHRRWKSDRGKVFKYFELNFKSQFLRFISRSKNCEREAISSCKFNTFHSIWQYLLAFRLRVLERNIANGTRIRCLRNVQAADLSPLLTSAYKQEIIIEVATRSQVT